MTRSKPLMGRWSYVWSREGLLHGYYIGCFAVAVLVALLKAPLWAILFFLVPMWALLELTIGYRFYKKKEARKHGNR